MKKHLLKLFMVGALVSFMTPSCTNLEEEVFSEFTEENFPNSEAEFISALGATYTSLYGFAGHNSYFSMQEVSSDEIMIPQRGSDWFDGGQWLRFHRHEYTPDEQSVNNGWNFLYGGINNCNRVVALFETLVADGSVDADQANGFIAEVKALRAMFYYWLLDGYGNVPVVTSFADADPSPATQSRQEVYNFVEAELLDAAGKVARSVDASTYARVNYATVQALLAKLYINAEVYTGTAQWAKAIAAADEVINSGSFSLEGNYFANFNALNDGSRENIFVIPYDRNQAQGFNIPAQTLHYSSQATFNLTFQPWNGYCTLQEFYDSYDDGDLRKGVQGNQAIRANFHAGPQFESDGATPLIDGSADDPEGQEIVFTPEINQHFPNCFRQAGARVGKFEYANGATQNLDNDFPILRYSDVLLMKAEALMRSGGDMAEALDLVNQVRGRAGLEAFSELTNENLLAERGREFFYEGWRRNDLIRFDAFQGDWDFKRDPDDRDATAETPESTDLELFPIPTNQLAANPNLVQNAGY